LRYFKRVDDGVSTSLEKLLMVLHNTLGFVYWHRYFTQLGFVNFSFV